MTPKRLLPLLITVACALATAPAASAASDVAQASSENWSGYVIGGSATGRRFASVSGSWTEPTANCSAGSSRYAAFWIGLGGSGQTQALEQAGTEADCSASGQASYFAWYELVPKAPVHLALAVSPGDRMSSTVSVSGSSVRIQLNDLTTGQSADRTLTMATPDVSSAEWIAEAPSACDGSVSSCTPLALTDFGTVNFTGARAVTTDGHAGTISDASWSTAAVSLSGSASSTGAPTFSVYDTGSGDTATPSSLSADGSAFSIAYSSSTSPGQTSAGASASGYPGGSGYGYGYGGGYGSGGGDSYGYGPGSAYGYGAGSAYGYGGDPGGY